MRVVYWALLGYGAGSLPFAYLAAVLTGNRERVSSVERTLGERDTHVILKEAGARRAATAAATLDVLKAFLPVLAARTAGPYEAAACGIGAVAGHCWPPVYRRYAGRGLSAAAGAFLPLVPVEMTVAGLVTVAGFLLRAGGLASTAGFASVPVVAALRGQPPPYLVMTGTVVVLVVVRRLEGVREDAEAGVPLGRAVLRRALLDRSRLGGSERKPA